jgi:aldehyde dehydrogenase (NAD+)
MSALIRSVSPQAPGDLVGEFRCLSRDEIRAIADRSRQAQRDWWASGAARRSAALAASSAELRARRDEAAALIVREVGKPAGEAAGEVSRALSILDYYAQASFAVTGSHFPPSVGELLYTERRPLGVAGLITPWNFPLAIPLWKAAPALAAGNLVLLKPSPEATACAKLLDEILGRPLPDGVFTVAPGFAEAGEAIVSIADVVSFTGSAAVGQAVATAAARRGIAVQCEMGGQNAAIVMPDADPHAAAALIASAAMAFAGQKCTATRRVIIVGRQPDFVAALVAAVERLTPADPAEAHTVVGPVINERAQEMVRAAAHLAVADGGRVLAGGNDLHLDGWFVEPTLIEDLPPDHTLCQEETFGPFAVIQHAADVDEAVALANGVRFGLVTSVHGQNLDQVLAAVSGLDTGLIKVNAPTTGVDFYAPFGGEKASSFGPREQGLAALEFYGTTRTITVAAQRA